MKNQYRDYQDDKDIPIGIPINMESNSDATFEKMGRENQILWEHQPHPQYPQHQYPQQQYQQELQQYQPQVQSVQQMQAYQDPDYSRPVVANCPCCKSNVITAMNYESGNSNYLWTGVISLVTLCCCGLPCCCCVPFMSQKCMDKNHYCPQCGFNILRKHNGLCELN